MTKFRMGGCSSPPPHLRRLFVRMARNKASAWRPNDEMSQESKLARWGRQGWLVKGADFLWKRTLVKGRDGEGQRQDRVQLVEEA